MYFKGYVFRHLNNGEFYLNGRNKGVLKVIVGYWIF